MMRGVGLLVAVVMICGRLDAAERALADYRLIYDGEVARIDAEHHDAVERLFWRYGRELDSAKGKRQEAGDLPGVLALIKEKERFVSARSVPSEAPAGAPSLVRELQISYHAAVERARTARVKSIIALSGKYTERLDAMKRQFVRDGKLDEAMSADSEIERVASIFAELEELLRNPPAPYDGSSSPGGSFADHASPVTAMPQDAQDGLLHTTRPSNEPVLSNVEVGPQAGLVLDFPADTELDEGTEIYVDTGTPKAVTVPTLKEDGGWRSLLAVEPRSIPAPEGKWPNYSSSNSEGSLLKCFKRAKNVRAMEMLEQTPAWIYMHPLQDTGILSVEFTFEEPVSAFSCNVCLAATRKGNSVCSIYSGDKLVKQLALKDTESQEIEVELGMCSTLRLEVDKSTDHQKSGTIWVDPKVK